MSESGSSGAGNTSVTRTFEAIFRREKIQSVIIEGDSFHRYDRASWRYFLQSNRAPIMYGEHRASEVGGHDDKVSLGLLLTGRPVVADDRNEDRFAFGAVNIVKDARIFFFVSRGGGQTLVRPRRR